MNIFFSIAAFSVSILLATPLVAQDFNAGLEAARNGNFETAFEKWLPLAERGDVRAQRLVALSYETGNGVLQDYAAAVRWYRMAAEQGQVDAQVSLGFIFSNGEGVPVDFAEAVRWYRMAAEQGDARAQTSLGFMYDNGIRNDQVFAHMWYSIGSANGNVVAGENREAIAKEMTREQIADAQVRARKCIASNYQDCD